MITLQERVHSSSPPADWSLNKLHRVLRVRKGYKNTGMQEDNLLSLSYGRIIRKSIDAAEGLLPESFETYQIVEPGNIVMRLTDLQNDKRSLRQGLVRERGIITSAYDALELVKGHDPRFWAYALLALDLAKYYYSLGGGVRQSIKFLDFPNDWIATPDTDTQKAIADFLDRETARIDQLIEKKGRLVDTMDRKWAATVTFTLTNGLDPDVCRKPSGTAWLDDIPNHWAVAKLGHIGRCANGINISGEAFGRGFPFVSYGDVYKNPQLPESAVGLVESSAIDRVRYSLKAGDILFTRTSETIEEIGFSSVCIKDIPDAVYAGFLIRFRPKKGVLIPRFSKFLFRNEVLREFFNKEMMIVTRASLSQGLLQKMPVMLPPLEEQEEIAKYLESKEKKYKALSEKTGISIDRLREFRSALITAAVTGQIDVSAWGKSGETDHRLDAIEEEMAL